MNIEDAAQALDAGAEFIVMPVMLPEVIRYCASRNVLCIPGCATPTELYAAQQAGALVQKLFPGVAGGAGKDPFQLASGVGLDVVEPLTPLLL